jgi:hypothetical protein
MDHSPGRDGLGLLGGRQVIARAAIPLLLIRRRTPPGPCRASGSAWASEVVAAGSPHPVGVRTSVVLRPTSRSSKKVGIERLLARA